MKYIAEMRQIVYADPLLRLPARSHSVTTCLMRPNLDLILIGYHFDRWRATVRPICRLAACTTTRIHPATAFRCTRL